MARRIILALITALTFAVAVIGHPPGITYACSCIAPAPAPQARDEAAAVFRGTVSTIDKGAGQGPDALVVTFDVNETWKGPIGPQIALGTSGSSASCGYEFVAGEEYIVYAFEQDTQLSTGLCTRTAPVSAAAADLEALGPGEAPNGGVVAPQPTAVPGDASTPPPAASSSFPWLPVGLGALLVLGLVAGAVGFTRRP